MNRTDIINRIIQERGYKSYLEIGVQNGFNFSSVKCEQKTGVDPDPKAIGATDKVTSDDFFKTNKETFDCIFIDGLHTYEQSKKDFKNALKALSKQGCIIMHDVLPHNEVYTSIDWCGEVYKTALLIAKSYNVITWDDDHGVLVVFPNGEAMKKGTVTSTYYPGIESLRESLNATSNIEDIV